MSRSTQVSRRSGDPRRRSGASPGASPARDMPGAAARGERRVVVTFVAVVGLAALAVGLALATTRPDAAPQVREQGRVHVVAACDLTAKAGEAARAVQLDSRSRYAAATLLLDRAIIESARAAETDPALADLDTALQAVHSAGHTGEPRGWKTALSAAMQECAATAS